MKNPRIQLATGIAISIVFLYLALRGVNPRDLWMAVSTFNWLWAIPFVFLTIFSMWLRAWRWRYFLLPTADIKTARLFSPLMAGFAINGLLPARIGEFARAYVLARTDKLPFTRVFGTIVVERIFDTLVLLGLLAYVFSTLEINPDIRYPYSTAGQVSSFILAAISFIIGTTLLLIGRKLHRAHRAATTRSHLAIMAKSFFISGIILMLLAPLLLALLPATVSYGSDYEISGESLSQLSGKVAILAVLLLASALMLVWPPACALIQRIVNAFPFLPQAVRSAVSSIINTFAEGMQSLRSPRLIAIVALQSLAVWMTIAWSMQIMPYGFDGMRAMTMSEAVALMVITCLAILIPAAPGYWGLMELGIKFGMVILAIDTNPSRVLAYALITHALQYFPITGIGLYYLWKSQISMSEIKSERPGATS